MTNVRPCALHMGRDQNDCVTLYLYDCINTIVSSLTFNPGFAPGPIGLYSHLVCRPIN